MYTLSSKQMEEHYINQNMCEDFDYIKKPLLYGTVNYLRRGKILKMGNVWGLIKKIVVVNVHALKCFQLNYLRGK